MEVTRMHLVVIQYWEESERGWGTRPDGYSLHLSDEDRIKFISTYWDSMPAGEAPDEYERPCGQARTTLVDDETFALVQNSRFGKRFYDKKL